MMSPLLLKASTTPNQRDRKIAEVLTKNMKVLGIRVESQTAKWPEQLKSARAGKLQMWFLGLSAASPDGGGTYARYDSRQIGGQNLSRVRLPAFDALYTKLETSPDGPERKAAFRKADLLAVAWMPYKFVLNRVSLDMAHPQVIGYRRPSFWNDWWQYVDIDTALIRKR